MGLLEDGGHCWPGTGDDNKYWDWVKMFDNRVTGLKHPLLRRLLWQMKSSFLLVGIKDQVGLLGRREGTIPTPSFCLRVEYIHSIVSTCGRLAFQGIRGIGWNWSLTIHWWQSVTQWVRWFNTSFLGWYHPFSIEWSRPFSYYPPPMHWSIWTYKRYFWGWGYRSINT